MANSQMKSQRMLLGSGVDAADDLCGLEIVVRHWPAVVITFYLLFYFAQFLLELLDKSIEGIKRSIALKPTLPTDGIGILLGEI